MCLNIFIINNKEGPSELVCHLQVPVTPDGLFVLGVTLACISLCTFAPKALEGGHRRDAGSGEVRVLLLLELWMHLPQE